MKYFKYFFSFLFVVIFVMCGENNNSDEQDVITKKPQLQIVWETFQDAVVEGDLDALEKITHFPFIYRSVVPGEEAVENSSIFEEEFRAEYGMKLFPEFIVEQIKQSSYKSLKGSRAGYYISFLRENEKCSITYAFSTIGDTIYFSTYDEFCSK